MLHNYLAAALRNLARNRLYAAINIIGLSTGFAAALLIAVFVHDEVGYDTWIPAADRTYAVATRLIRSDGVVDVLSNTSSSMMELLKADYPVVEDAARLFAYAGANLGREGRTYVETIYWGDPSIFRVLALPAAAGNPAAALEQPDGVVLTRRMARKLFGREDVLGESLELDRRTTLRVGAVLEDLPSNTTLDTEIIVSGRNAFSALTAIDRNPPGAGPVRGLYGFIRLKAGSGIEGLAGSAEAFSIRRQKDNIGDIWRRSEPLFVALPDLHLADWPPSSLDQPMKPRGNVAAIEALSAVGLVIVALALVSFVGLMTARAGRRAVEIGVRKVSGAARRHLTVQFLGETALWIAACMVIGAVAGACILPAMNGFLGRAIPVSAFLDPVLLAFCAALWLAASVAAGVYPAFVLSRFHPAAVLRAALRAQSGNRLRRFLVAGQFGIFIGLLVMTGVVYRQTDFAKNEGLRLDKDQVIVIRTRCLDSFKEEVAKLPGVRAAACSGLAPVDHAGSVRVRSADGQPRLKVMLDPIDFGLLELYGLKPLAGRFPSPGFGNDAVTAGQAAAQPNVVVNQSAAARMGFESPEAAVGRTVVFGPTGMKMLDDQPMVIVGVVQDFPTGALSTPIEPTVFYVNPGQFQGLHVKLDGRGMPDTLRAISVLWSGHGNLSQLPFTFFDQRVEEYYRDVTRTGQLFGMFSAVAMLIACLGLFGFSAYRAEGCTKEIGIRKAMGASRADIMRVMVWDFVRPVLWANAAAWPVGYFAMRRWLEGFAYHVELSAWIFLAASALALVIAVATVAGHALMVARAEPVSALRYE